MFIHYIILQVQALLILGQMVSRVCSRIFIYEITLFTISFRSPFPLQFKGSQRLLERRVSMGGDNLVDKCSVFIIYVETARTGYPSAR